jgi:hypothetical protein
VAGSTPAGLSITRGRGVLTSSRAGGDVVRDAIGITVRAVAPSCRRALLGARSGAGGRVEAASTGRPGEAGASSGAAMLNGASACAASMAPATACASSPASVTVVGVDISGTFAGPCGAAVGVAAGVEAADAPTPCPPARADGAAAAGVDGCGAVTGMAGCVGDGVAVGGVATVGGEGPGAATGEATVAGAGA